MKRVIIYTCLTALAAWTGLVVAYENGFLPGWATLAFVHLAPVGLATLVGLAAMAVLWLRWPTRQGRLRWSLRTLLILVLLVQSTTIVAMKYGRPWRCEHIFTQPSEVYNASFSPDGTTIAIYCDGQIKILDAFTGSEITCVGQQPGFPDTDYNNPCFTPDGSRILAAAMQLHIAIVWDVATGNELLRLVGHEHWVPFASFSSDGTRIITASIDHTTRVWDSASGNELLRLSHEGAFSSAVFSPDDTKILTAGLNNTPTMVWDSTSGRALLRLDGNANGAWLASYSPDGAKIVTAASDRAPRVWDASSGRELVRFHGRNVGGIRTAVFSPDGKRIATAGRDGTPRIWDASTGQELAHLRHKLGFDHSPVVALFSPDGERIVTTSGDKTFRIWVRTRPERWWGWFCVPWTYVSLILFGLLCWSGFANRRRVKAPPTETSAG